MIKKQDLINEYNKRNPGYYITGIKKLAPEQIESCRKRGARSLEDLYESPSDAKISSYNKILRDYTPREIIAVQGSCHTYSVLLEAGNGDILHITQQNNYLVNVG